MSMDYTIREATTTDVPVLVSFQQNMAKETEGLHLDPTIVTAGINNMLADPSKGKYYVATQNNLVAGCLMITNEWSDWRNGNVLWIQSVFIDPAHRGKNVYRKMYEHIQQMVLGSSALRGIRLYVDKSNKAAQAVYEKLGMNGEHYQVYEWMK
jgi:ribosomal protein S18 acetylase RimI-like enzyme